MGSNEVLLVILEEAHCLAQAGNINGMDYSRQPVERFITQSNRDIYIVCRTPCWCIIFVQINMEDTQNAVDFFLFLRGGGEGG